MLTRKHRTQEYKLEIKKKWFDYFWDSIINYFKLDSISFSNLSRNPNITLDRIIQHPHFFWSNDEISSNPNITFEMVKNTPYLKWNYHFLSLNPGISWNDILSEPNLPWDWRNLAEKPGIEIETIRKHFNELNPKLLIHNPSVTLEMIESNLDLNWDWKEIPMRDNLTFPKLLEIVDKFQIELMEKHWIVISSQIYICWDIVLENNHLPWKFESLSYNPNITYDIICDNPEYPWSWKHFSYNPNFRNQYLLEKPTVLWDWEYISENHLTPVFLIQNPNLPYCWNSIQMNPLFSFQDITQKFCLKPEMNYLTLNPKISLQDIRDNRDYNWDWFWLSSCDFEIDKKNFYLFHFRRWIAAYRIQQWYQKIKHSPLYVFGRKHINSMYDNNFTI